MPEQITWIELPLHETGFWSTTNVRDLISALQQMPPDALVFSEGCDCTGNVAGVSLEKDGNVMLVRKELE